MSHISIVTIFEQFFDSALSVSIPARAIESGAAQVDFSDPRKFATDKHRTVDDSPYGGGAGMVMRAPELGAAVESCQNEESFRPVILMSPQGRRFDQGTARRLAERNGFILVCGRYEGVDERFVEEHVDEELSVGDFVLSGGEPAAMVVVDTVLRLLPDVLGNEASLDVESFGSNRLEAPHFTRPAVFADRGIPDVLLSGHHKRIADWRRKVSLLRTRARRPDLFAKIELTEHDQRVLDDEELKVEDWLIRPRFSRSGS